MFITPLLIERIKVVHHSNGFINALMKVNPFTPRNVKYKLSEDLVWQYDGKKIIVPTGFITDLASVPRVLCCVLPPDGPYINAAVLHDYLYATGMTSKRKSDSLLMTAMNTVDMNGVIWRIRYDAMKHTLYTGVVLFGKTAWIKWSELRERHLDQWSAQCGLTIKR